MNTDTDEFRASHDTKNEEEWSSDEAGAAQERLMAEGFESTDDEAAPVDPQLDRHWDASALTEQHAQADEDTAEPDIESGVESDVEPDDAAAFDERTQNTHILSGGVLPASDPVQDTDSSLDTDSGLTPGTVGTPSADPVDSSEFGGVAKPEDLGGRDIGAGSEPLVGAEAQEEFLSRWMQIQISFLEDPPTAVETAEMLIQDISAAIRTSLEERSSELVAGGQAAADTEQLRLALRQYRAFIGVVLPK